MLLYIVVVEFMLLLLL